MHKQNFKKYICTILAHLECKPAFKSPLQVAKSNCIKGNPICGFFLGVTGFRIVNYLLTLCLLTLHMIRHNVQDKFLFPNNT